MIGDPIDYINRKHRLSFGQLRDIRYRVRCEFSKVLSGRILAVPDPLLEVRSPVLTISRPIPQPNPCTTDRIRPAPCSGAKTAIAPTAKRARIIILTTMLLEIEAEETDRRGQRARSSATE